MSRTDAIHRFGRPQRLLKAAEFKQVFSQAEKSTDRYFTLLARPNLLTRARLGVTVAKKKVRTAVQRNRIKRLIRESFRHHLPDLPPCDYVVLAREGIECFNNQTLLHSLAKHWQRFTLQRKNSSSD